MYIIHLAAELAPIAKVGGLGDVLHGLSRQLMRLGHTVEVILPKHHAITEENTPGLRRIEGEFSCPFGGNETSFWVWQAEVDGIPLFLLDPQGEYAYFQRDNIYGYLDDVERYTYFSRAALEFLQATGKSPDILHLHEWQTAVAAPLYRDLYKGKASIAYTIHNLAHQGQCSPYDLDRVGLHGYDYLKPEKLQDDEIPTLLNLMKGAIIYSNGFNTVSPTYAEEIINGVHHHGLEETIRHYREKFSGILNGIDTEWWNPGGDPFLYAPYCRDDLRGKQENKHRFQKEHNLEVCSKPFVATITRLAMQKGIPLVRRALFRTLEQGGQFAVLGSPATQRIEEEFLSLKEQFRQDGNVYIELGHSEQQAHRLFAASDMVMAPSLFEPCGLVQLIGMRYGSVPIVRQTGGFADTVFDIDYSNLEERQRNGFVFEHADTGGVDSALDRAIRLYQDNPIRWREIMDSGMARDVSWESPAKQYVEFYERIRH